MTRCSRRCLAALLLALASGCSLRGLRSDPLLFSLEDPRRDDHGDGTLRYPLRPDMQPGDLDLVRLEAYSEEGGTRFEATFTRPIAVPEKGRTVDVAGGTLTSVARYGFYTFNLDIYIDTDNVPGMGREDTLPGRGVKLSPLNAWEKAVVLSPRPYEARDVLRGAWFARLRNERLQRQGLTPDAQQALEREVERQLAQNVFFPTRIRVRGRTIEFFVPLYFLGGHAQPGWGYAVAVTGAVLDQRVDMQGLFGQRSSGDGGMTVMGVAPGPMTDRFGGSWAGLGQPPIVDLLVPEEVRQEEVLAPQGLPWPAVVPARRLPQAPEGSAPGGQGGPPGP